MSLENEILAYQIEKTSEKKKARLFISVWTVLYLLYFPFVLQLALKSIFVFDNPRMTVLWGLSIIFGCLCIPFSMLVSIWKMWSQYFKKNYSKAYWFFSLPLLTFTLINLFEWMYKILSLVR